ncbi:NHLP bacteriocin export ABC transporter permease/ATPase subunit [Lentzea tibetensis]|uniref:NHLP bacteriocin export ABC transporter permease/ATPase subunit n=1 Tax=Lentzea tibetensis TaxID=2591470 RepID=A0A563ES46_9PSEU|nr:NHLP bacteriocin export ABC transporter permease/ATPase subunit [Lentzea tibetensis]TWP50480.1 NHLP bacteriocin export ABC transporter permease/ATPase subunit [Lentzea tibetensis]
MTQLVHPDAVELLGHLGEQVALPAAHRMPLDGRTTLWLVTGGELDVFAVDTGEGGRWHFIGRVRAGTILSAPVRGPKHTLVARPVGDAGLSRLRVGDLVAAQRDRWERHGGGLSPEEKALAHGIDLGLVVLMDFVRDGLPPREFVPLLPGTEVEMSAGQDARPVDGVLWVDVLKGRMRAGGHGTSREREAGESVTICPQDWVSCDLFATLKVRDTEGLLADGLLWENLLKLQARILYQIDRAVERQDRAGNDLIAAGRATGEAVRDRANQALRTVLLPDDGSMRGEVLGTDDSPVVAACRLAAGELGITVVAPESDQADSRVGPIERIATRSRFRTRTIALKDRWWQADVGPLVGFRAEGHAPVALLWRRGGYEAVDPETGARTAVTAQSAGEIESRAVMFYLPLPEKPVRSWQLMAFGLKGSLRDVRNLCTAAAVAVLLGLLVPITTGQVLGEFVPNAQTSLIIQLCLALVLASLVSAAFALLENVALLRIEGRFESTLQAAVWDRLLRLPARFFTRYSTGELASAALGVKHIRAVLMGVSSVALHSGVLALFNFLLLFWFSVPLALLAGLFVLVGIVVFVVLGLRQMRWQGKALELDHRLANKVFQTLRALPKLRVAAAENRAYGDWAGDFVREKEFQKKVGRYQDIVTVFNAAYVPLCTMLLFIALAGPARDVMSVAEFLAFNAAFAIMLTSMMQFTSSVTSVIAIVPMYRRLVPVLTEPLEVSEANTVPGELSGDIEVNHLSFGYAEDAPPVLNDVSFHIRPGEFVAVVGPSGCGKSTLLRLLLGFEKPVSGTVLYDGQDLSSLDTAAVRRQCGVVLQQAKPTTGTIYQAIAGAQNFTIDDAWAAAEMAGLEADIRAMPMGMHTILSDGGTLSGGQRQRLVIAQALIRKPRILFFDEATSALDNETQRVVTESTQRLRATRIVIAHRLSTVMDADRVIVLNAGQVEQFGSPADLLADTDGLFHQLVRRQMQ